MCNSLKYIYLNPYPLSSEMGASALLFSGTWFWSSHCKWSHQHPFRPAARECKKTLWALGFRTTWTRPESLEPFRSRDAWHLTTMDVTQRKLICQTLVQCGSSEVMLSTAYFFRPSPVEFYWCRRPSIAESFSPDAICGVLGGVGWE